MHELKIDDRVTFYGRVDKSVLNDIYPQMDAFLLTLCSEAQIGFSANTVPAKFQGYISAGKPVLASIDGGAKEIIESTRCGLVVKANDVTGFAAIIKEFVENPEKYKECGLRGKQYFDANYDKNVVIDKMENLLIKLQNDNKE